MPFCRAISSCHPLVCLLLYPISFHECQPVIRLSICWHSFSRHGQPISICFAEKSTTCIFLTQFVVWYFILYFDLKHLSFQSFLRVLNICMSALVRDQVRHPRVIIESMCRTYNFLFRDNGIFPTLRKISLFLPKKKTTKNTSNLIVLFK